MRRMITSIVVLILLGGFTVAAAQLPPEIMVDRYLLQAERFLAEDDYGAALDAMNEIVALQSEHNLDMPDEFHFKYARVALSAGLNKAAIDSVNKYLLAAGREGEFYREALELLDEAEAGQAAAEAARRRAEADRRLADAERQRVEAQERENDELARRQMEEAGTTLPRNELRSGGLGPEMVRIASGRFQYHTRQPWGEHLHWVEFDRPFAISRHEVTRGEFERFVDSTDFRTEAREDPEYGCAQPGARYSTELSRNSLRWNRPGFDQTDNHPVTCVSIRDASAYAEWLSRETGHTYRLPSAAEWQYVARAGSSAAMLWRNYEDILDSEDPTVCRHGNFRDSSTGGPYAVGCSDGARRTAEVGQFQPNEVGVYDMNGNVAELTLACLHPDGDSYPKVAPEGSPELPSSCDQFVLASGSDWDSSSIVSYLGDQFVPVRPGLYANNQYRKSSNTSVGA